MLAAAIPIYNERRAITLVIAAVRPFVDRILVVDDGSTDGSGRLAAEAGAEIVSHRRNQGKGASLQSALPWAKAKAGISELILIDGDGQHDPADFRRWSRSFESDSWTCWSVVGFLAATTHRSTDSSVFTF